jgi:phage-related baseplate assembly protein
MANPTPPQFTVTDPAQIEQQAIADWQTRTGEQIYPAMPEALFFKTLAYILSLNRLDIQRGFENGLPQFATGSHLDAIAKLFNLTRQANETDDALRERIYLAPSQYGSAGSVEAYRFWALSVDPAIVDVAVLNPAPLQVRVYILAATGLPSAPLIAAVQAKLTADNIKPICDIVTVSAPTEQQYNLNATIQVYASADQATVNAALQTAAQQVTAKLRGSLGMDIVRSQFIAALSVPGVYSVSLTQPAADVILDGSQWANATAINVSISGSVPG